MNKPRSIIRPSYQLIAGHVLKNFVCADGIRFELHRMPESLRATITASFNGYQIGYLELGELPSRPNCYDIWYGLIDEKFMRQGYYSRLFRAAFELIPDCKKILSDDRNQLSNAVWSHWAGERLGIFERVWMLRPENDEEPFKVEFDRR